MSKKPLPPKKNPKDQEDEFDQAIRSAAISVPTPSPAPAPARQLSSEESFFAAIRDSAPNQTVLAKQAAANPTLAAHVDSGGFNALTLAMLSRKTELAKVLVALGSDLHCTSKAMGWNPFVLACGYALGEDHLALSMLDKGANSSAKTHDGLYALTAACTYGNEPLARLLLDSGASAHPSDVGWPPVVAASGSSASLVRLLVERGADVNKPIGLKNGYTALHHAAKSGRLDVVQYLLELGAPLNPMSAEGETPLHYAAQREDPALAKLLLNKGADATLESVRRKTPGDMAGSPAVAKLLEKASGGKRTPNPMAGKKPKATDDSAPARKTSTKKTDTLAKEPDLALDPSKLAKKPVSKKAMVELARAAAKKIAAKASLKKSSPSPAQKQTDPKSEPKARAKLPARRAPK